MNKRTTFLFSDAIGWNSYLWGSVLREVIEKIGYEKFLQTEVIEIGASQVSSLAPIFAYFGAVATAGYFTDDPTKYINRIEKEFGLQGKLRVKFINILDKQDHEVADFIVAKSVLGGISRNRNEEQLQQCLKNMKGMLKEGGYIVLLDNAKGTSLHELMRNKFGAGKSGWHYFSLNEYKKFVLGDNPLYFCAQGFFSFADYKYSVVNYLLYQLDRIFSIFIPNRYKVVFACIIGKSEIS